MSEASLVQREIGQPTCFTLWLHLHVLIITGKLNCVGIVIVSGAMKVIPAVGGL